VLFNDSVVDNIAYRDASHSRDALFEVADAANALDFIETLPKDFDTLIGENGVRLSGGQCQRLAIAWALLKKSFLLILDEATSALDSKSEKLVQSALENLMESRTTIVIAHRLSTIENAGRIVVIHHGEIAEVGSLFQLLAREWLYSKLHSFDLREGSPA
jgi:ATP-binding cassette, subfamily B, bacterial MsbA